MYLRIAVPKIVEKMKNTFDGTYFCEAAGDFIKKEVYMRTITIFKSTYISLYYYFWSCFSKV